MFSSFLPLVIELTILGRGKEIHGYIVRNDMPLDAFLKSALIDLYFKCRNVKMACKIFNQSITIDLVMCTAVISGYVLNGMNNDALEMYRRLLHEKISPNAVTLSPASVLPDSLDALKLYMYSKWERLDQMAMEGIKHGRVSISNALYACASLPALSYGKEIHCHMIKGGCISDIFAKILFVVHGNVELAEVA
ncbi:hypothetical protein EZV62_003923 [Acer yangbiense]|uniref:Pentatricopeptide repeat-containing protein n=1 Tax=Acer yangbiense TaxID=1000413 RepID=A0A5C7IIM7_9ROSI|nr:hypothetical protein EZV62_003923 [Acer yangbiense]